MKKTSVFGILLFALFIINFVFAGSVESISPEQAFKLQTESKAILLVVREPAELVDGKVKGALTIPISIMNNDRTSWEKKISGIKKDKTVIVYCRSGGRAKTVGSELVKMGYKVFNLGGFDNWKSKGLPTD